MQINPNAQVRVERLGGLVPVLFIDDFYLDPDEVRNQGLAGRYDMAAALYPGRHARITADEGSAVLAHLCQVLTLLGGQAFDPQHAWTDFSILTVKASELLMVQKHPHIDPVAMAGVLYMTPGNTQGTCLYFNRVLGKFSLISDDDKQAHEKFLDEYGEVYEPDGYDVRDNPLWQCIGTIKAQYNRFVCYPGNVFHSIDLTDVPAEFDIANVRLTQRFFFDVSPPKDTVNA